jgi:hypothetical protein
MLRDFSAADFFTLGNGLAGCGATLAFMRYCAEEQARFFWNGQQNPAYSQAVSESTRFALLLTKMTLAGHS